MISTSAVVVVIIFNIEHWVALAIICSKIDMYDEKTMFCGDPLVSLCT